MIADPIAIFFILASVVFTAIWLEKNNKTFKKLGAGAIVILLGMLLSNFGFIPGDSGTYDLLMSTGVSGAIVLILLSVDIRSIRKAGPDMLKAFFIGAFGSAVGSIIMAFILSDAIGAETWKLSGQFTGTYVGGGVNFAALARAFDTSSDLFTAALAADVILTAFWLVACLVVPILLGRNGNENSKIKSSGKDTFTLEQSLYRSKHPIRISHFAALIALTLGVLWSSQFLASLVSFLPEVLWLTTIVLLLAQLPIVKQLSGSAMLGNYLLLLFLASNGAKSIIANIVAVGPEVFYYALGTVFIHGVIIFGLGSLFRIDLGTLAVASQANIGGSSSAIAMASARGYGDRILSAVAVGLLGYAIGNYLGLAVGQIMHNIL